MGRVLTSTLSQAGLRKGLDVRSLSVFLSSTFVTPRKAHQNAQSRSPPYHLCARDVTNCPPVCLYYIPTQGAHLPPNHTFHRTLLHLILSAEEGAPSSMMNCTICCEICCESVGRSQCPRCAKCSCAAFVHKNNQSLIWPCAVTENCGPPTVLCCLLLYSESSSPHLAFCCVHGCYASRHCGHPWKALFVFPPP